MGKYLAQHSHLTHAIDVEEYGVRYIGLIPNATMPPHPRSRSGRTWNAGGRACGRTGCHGGLGQSRGQTEGGSHHVVGVHLQYVGTACVCAQRVESVSVFQNLYGGLTEGGNRRVARVPAAFHTEVRECVLYTL